MVDMLKGKEIQMLEAFAQHGTIAKKGEMGVIDTSTHFTARYGLRFVNDDSGEYDYLIVPLKYFKIINLAKINQLRE